MEQEGPASPSSPKRLKKSQSESVNGHMIASSAKAPQNGPTSAPSSVVVQFFSREGEQMGTQVDIPLDSTAQQLEVLMNHLQNGESTKVGSINSSTR